jgi:hypothetical protein
VWIALGAHAGANLITLVTGENFSDNLISLLQGASNGIKALTVLRVSFAALP